MEKLHQERINDFQKHLLDVLRQPDVKCFIFSIFIHGKRHDVAIYDPDIFEVKRKSEKNTGEEE